MIPKIISSTGRTPDVRVLDDAEFLIEVEKKLLEEAQEYLKDRDIEELADVLEVVYAIARLRGIGREQLEGIRTRKTDRRGAFESNLFLVGVDG